MLLKEGDIIELEPGQKVYAKVPRHFLYSDCQGDFELEKGLVEIGGDLKYLAGRYVVYKTAFDGGGTGHGPGDVYPDGHHVFCERLKGRQMKVDFYQTGCFTAMIEDIKPVAHASRKWVEPAKTPPAATKEKQRG